VQLILYRGWPLALAAPHRVQMHPALEVTRWQYDFWYRVAEAALAGAEPNLDNLPHLDRAAMTSYMITTPRIADWFGSFNDGKPYHQQTRAFGFLISPIVRALDKPLGRAGQPFHLIALRQNTKRLGNHRVRRHL
jgi:hypothetical protein